MKNTIEVNVDNLSEMASVYLNGKHIMSGNFWDFHPNCHGIHEYGEFKGYRGLANAIALKIGDCEIITKRYTPS